MDKGHFWAFSLQQSKEFAAVSNIVKRVKDPNVSVACGKHC